MPSPQNAYEAGRAQAFQKFALDVSSHGLITALGGVNPLAGAMGAGAMAPDGYGAGQFARTGIGSGAGAVAGEAGGEAAGELLARLLKQDPSLFKRLGSVLGRTTGGAVGAHVGHTWANNSMSEDMHKKQMGG